MYENELARGNNVHLEAGDEGRGGANFWLATQPLWGVGKWQWWRSGCVLPFCHQLLWKKGGGGEGNYNQTKKEQTKMIRQKYPKLSLFNGWQKKFKSKWRECPIEWEKIGIVTQVEPCLYSCLAALSSPSPDHVDYDVSGKILWLCTGCLSLQVTAASILTKE